MRPDLSTTIDPSLFLEYYWLKEELSDFCREQAIPASGSKDELTARIHSYLKNVTVPVARPTHTKKSHQAACDSPLTPDSIIPAGYRNDERHLRKVYHRLSNTHLVFKY